MLTRKPLISAWSLRTLDLGRVHIETTVLDVVVRFEVFTGGGYAASNVVVRVAGRVVAIRAAGTT